MNSSYELKSWLARVLDSEQHLDSDFFHSQQWIVVPVESGLHFDDSDIRRIAPAIQLTGNKKLNAVLIEDVSNVVSHLQFEADFDGFQQFNHECGHFNYAICPNDRSFLIVCTTNGYYLLAGKQGFVESALGMSIIEGRKAFDVFANDDSWPELEKSVFRGIAIRYNE